jgi:hypothetical protein
MEKQNVTLAIPKEILHKAKLIAVERRTSLSGLMTQLLSEVVAREDRYANAHKRHLAWLEHGADLGTGGTANWTREDLHER